MSKSAPLVLQFARFLGAGAVSTVAHYAVLIGFVQLMSTDAILASVFGFCTGAVVNYLVNYHYTFDSSQPHTATLPRFIGVALVGVTLNTAAMSVQIKTLGLHYLVAQVLATVVVVLWNFAGNKLWTFDRR